MQDNQELTQSLGAMLGLGENKSQQPEQPVSTDNTGPQTVDNVPEPPVQQENVVENNNQQVTEETNNMRQLRQQYEDVKKRSSESDALLKRIADSMGITVDKLSEKIQSEEDKKAAASKNIPTEVQQQLRQQEEKIRNLELANMKADYMNRSQKLANMYNLSENQMVDFARQAEQLGFNVFTPGLDMVTLYRAINYQTVEANLRNQIRQEVLAELQKGQQANTVQSNTNIPSNKSDGIDNSKDFMKQLFANLPK